MIKDKETEDRMRRLGRVRNFQSPTKQPRGITYRVGEMITAKVTEERKRQLSRSRDLQYSQKATTRDHWGRRRDRRKKIE